VETGAPLYYNEKISLLHLKFWTTFNIRIVQEIELSHDFLWYFDTYLAYIVSIYVANILCFKWWLLYASAFSYMASLWIVTGV